MTIVAITRTFTDFFGPGDTVNLRIEPASDGRSALRLEITEPTEPMLLGITGLPGAEWNSYLSFYGKSKIAVTRTFGKDNLYGADADGATEWTRWATEKWVGADPTMHMVLSCKDDADEYLDAWAATFPARADMPVGWRGCTLSPWHEPEDDVRKGAITWAWLRSQGTSIVSWRERHPRGKELVRYVGPVLTRWDLVELGNDPRNAGFEGMNIFMFDAYQASPKDGRYLTPQEMIDAPADRIHAAYPGIALGVPEYGYAKQANDPTGSGWVNAHRALVNHGRARGDVRFMIAFNSAGSMPEVPFYTSGPVAALYRNELLS